RPSSRRCVSAARRSRRWGSTRTASPSSKTSSAPATATGSRCSRPKAFTPASISCAPARHRRRSARSGTAHARSTWRRASCSLPRNLKPRSEVMTRWRSLLIRAAALWAAALWAASASANELRFGLQADPTTLDPAQSTAYIERIVFAAVCDKLIEIDAGLNYVPQLATEWHWGADGLSLTMKLRAGVVFQDGEPLDAQAVRANIERYKTASYSKRQTELKSVKSVSVIDPLTVRLDLSEPYAPLLAQLADRAGMMVSPKAI